MKTRTRKRGFGNRIDYHPTGGDQQVIQFTWSVSWTPKTGGSAPSKTTRYPLKYGNLFSIPGTDVPVVWRKNTVNEWYIDGAQLAIDVKRLLSPLISQDLLDSKTGLPRTPFLVAYERSTMTDVVGSGFRSKQGKEIVINPCSSLSEFYFGAAQPIKPQNPLRFEVLEGSSSLSFASVIIQIIWTPSSYVGLTEGMYKQLQNGIQARAQPSDHESVFSDAYLKVEQAAFEALTSLAEAPKTVKYIVGRLRDLGAILAAVKRRDFSFLKGHGNIDSVADAWLEARYAVRPIIYDISGILAALGKGSLAPIQTFRSGDNQDESFTSDFTITHGTLLSGEVSIAGDIIETARAGVYGRLDFDSPALQNFGLGNLGTTAWELIPWSFVVSWFVNVSGLIASLNPNPVYRRLGGFISVRKETYYTGTVNVSSSSGEQIIPISGSVVSYERIRKDTPGFINLDIDLDIPKVLDLLAFAKRLI